DLLADGLPVLIVRMRVVVKAESDETGASKLYFGRACLILEVVGERSGYVGVSRVNVFANEHQIALGCIDPTLVQKKGGDALEARIDGAIDRGIELGLAPIEREIAIWE